MRYHIKISSAKVVISKKRFSFIQRIGVKTVRGLLDRRGLFGYEGKGVCKGGVIPVPSDG